MNREIKFNSVQGGPFTISQNRINFNIPSDGVYDMSEAYINLNVKTEITESSTTEGVGVYVNKIKLGAEVDGQQPNLDNVQLVKNAILRTERQGSIENIRRVDQISNVLSLYNNSVLDVRGKSVLNATQLNTNFGFGQFSLESDINKLGVVKSKQNDITPIKIMLKDIFDFCHQAVEFDTTKTGAVSLECELNIDKLSVESTNDSTDWADGIDDEWADATVEGDANEIKTNWIMTNLSQSPYYVGQKLNITATGAGGAPNIADVPAVISSIEWVDSGADKGKLIIQFENKWGDIGAGQSYTAISVATVAPSAVSIEANFGELVLLKLNKMSSEFDEIEYSTFSTEQDNGNNLKSFQKQYQIEGDADCVVVAFPSADNELLSINQHIIDYRLRLNNDDLTDRDIELESPLHYDRINMSMTQMNLKLKNLSENRGTVKDMDLFTNLQDSEVQQQSIMSPLVQTPNEKLLQVNINTDPANGVNKITLFKHRPRVFKY